MSVTDIDYRDYCPVEEAEQREREREKQLRCEHWFGERLADGRLKCRCGATYKPNRVNKYGRRLP